jgi:CelD/BcsL family acetyltransferase involved in cellulose biosynthesis
MTIDGEDAAMVYSFIAHSQLHFYWTAFKLKYESSLSIGQMLIMQVIRDACADGIQLFDFIHGEAEYKRYWATDCYQVNRVVISRSFLGHSIAMSYYVVWQLATIKFLKLFFRRIRSILHTNKKRP